MQTPINPKKIKETKVENDKLTKLYTIINTHALNTAGTRYLKGINPVFGLKNCIPLPRKLSNV